MNLFETISHISHPKHFHHTCKSKLVKLPRIIFHQAWKLCIDKIYVEHSFIEYASHFKSIFIKILFFIMLWYEYEWVHMKHNNTKQQIFQIQVHKAILNSTTPATSLKIINQSSSSDSNLSYTLNINVFQVLKSH